LLAAGCAFRWKTASCELQHAKREILGRPGKAFAGNRNRPESPTMRRRNRRPTN
jgi:hypothetical protein